MGGALVPYSQDDITCCLKHYKELVKEMGDRPRWGEFRVNKDKNVLVTVGRRAWNDKDPDDEAWAVEEINSGQTYWLKQTSLGPSLNEMEVIAWAAKE